MAANPTCDKIGKEGIARLIEGRTDAAEHLGAGGSELGFGDVKCEPLHFGLADVAGLVSDRGNFRGDYDLLACVEISEADFGNNYVIHGDNYSTPLKFVKFDVLRL